MERRSLAVGRVGVCHRLMEQIGVVGQLLHGLNVTDRLDAKRIQNTVKVLAPICHTAQTVNECHEGVRRGVLPGLDELIGSLSRQLGKVVKRCTPL